ncbi:MAG: hypothetical protein ACYDEQ_04120 [Desulfocucumaceae bacterium]
MTWVSGHVWLDLPAERQRLFNGDIVIKKVNDLVLHGVVTEAERKTPVSGALVEIYARFAGGQEVLLSHSYSSGDGHYLLTLNKKSIPAGTRAIYIRAANGFLQY